MNEKFGQKEYFNDRRFDKEDVQILFAFKTKIINCTSKHNIETI